MGEGVAKLDRAEEERGDGVRVLLRFFEVSPARRPMPGVLVFFSGLIEWPERRGEEEDEVGCLRAISVADKLLVLLDKLVLDLLGSPLLDVRILARILEV